ncbi:3D-(3,5/4)-trihydroxycyclohexane-1,2-dione hydrolase [uncultured archaeon]|nr:3D-(3,5/4)-trihydroxycyclohexane-1,2-dione hydrolase [uncultured archaeon]
MMKLSDYVIDFLVSEGVTHIFEVCGGSLAHLLDSLFERKDISTISMHHEMAAAIAAEGYSRVCEEGMGVAMATSGPGATNLITGIASCFFDSIPCLFITGQVNTYELKSDKPTRQIGFQETDIVNIVKTITKKAELIMHETRIRYCLEDAIHTAKHGRSGPVLLDLPLNIQRATIEPGSLPSFDNDHNNKLDNINRIDENVIDRVVEIIKSSCRPIILAGGGVRLSKGQDELLKLSHNTGIPVVTSLMGIDAFPHDNPLFVGMIGTYGNRYANLTIANADLVIALGTRLDTRQTGTKPDTFARVAKIIHVDIDQVELNNKIEVESAINSDIRMFLCDLNKHDFEFNSINSWKETIKSFKEKYPSFCMPNGEAIAPNYFMHILSTFLPEDAIICVDRTESNVGCSVSRDKGHTKVLDRGWDGVYGMRIADGDWCLICSTRKDHHCDCRRWWISAQYPRASDGLSSQSAD